MLAIEERQRLIDSDVEQLARDSGWEHSCGWPDCCWRWTKEFEGKQLQEASASSAIHVETSIHSIQNPEAWPDSEGEY